MPLTVYAENMGLFHKGSGGKGIAAGDVCLSPPPAPVGPVPIPYVNLAQASDLVNGSKTVRVDGEPTALEDASKVATSSGDDAGNQGGSVITAMHKGTAYFMLWSSTVQVEGKGVCRHGDPMGQNCASAPFSAMCSASIVQAANFVDKQVPERADWIEIRLEDDQQEPVPGVAYEITLPDGSVVSGVTNADGVARYSGIKTGNCKITFTDLDDDSWQPAS